MGEFAGRSLGCARQVIGTGAEASCGAHSSLVAFCKGVDPMDWKDFGQEDGTSMPWQTSSGLKAVVRWLRNLGSREISVIGKFGCEPGEN
jgi:hypothetical protein